MSRDLETPLGQPGRWAEELYRARDSDIRLWRPIFTGDVFDGVPIPTSTGAIADRKVMVLQHPCAMRSDGVNLASRVLVSEVHSHSQLTPDQWLGYTKLMPLPDFFSAGRARERNQAAMFDRLEVVESNLLDPKRPLVCLTQYGVNLLLQRRVHYDTRVVVTTDEIAKVTGGVFEEADIIEDWCEAASRVGNEIADATGECMTWLREDLGGGLTRQQMLEDEQNRSSLRRAARKWTAEHYSG